MTYYEDFCKQCEKKKVAGIPISERDLHFWIKIRESGTKPEVCPKCGKGVPLFWQESMTWLCRKCEGGERWLIRPGCASSQFVKGYTPWNKKKVDPISITEPKCSIESQHTKLGRACPVQEPSILEKSCAFGRFL
jgi:hypothetical protein